MNNLIKVGHQHLTAFFSRGLKFATPVLAAMLAVNSAHAANATWTGTGDSVWSNINNWTASPVPGFNDVATFNGPGNGKTNIDLSAGVIVSNILFDTSSAAAYTIGLGTADTQLLGLQSNGVITVNSTVTAPQTISASVTLGTNAVTGNYNIANNSAQPLTILGTISSTNGGTAGTKLLFLGGSGSITINNVNNGGATVGLRKIGSGVLTLNGADTTTGGIIISNGTLNLVGSLNTGTAGNLAVGGSNTDSSIAICNLPASTSTTTSIVNITSGGSSVYIGNGAQDLINSRGILNQFGGTITVGQNLMLGRNATNTRQAYGFYNLKGGTFHHTGTNRLRIGQGDGGPDTAYLVYITGTGFLLVDAVGIGLNDSANTAGDGSGGDPAILYVAAGGIITNNSGGLNLGIGGKVTGCTNVVTVAESGTIVLRGTCGLGTSASGSAAGAAGVGRVGILNINNGGFLQTSNVFLDANNSPVGYVNFNGGTLKAQLVNTAFMTGINRATMYSGGLTVDDNGAAITIGQSLLAPTGTGVVSIAVSGATNYVGAPYVKIAGGNPTVPATAVALIDGNGNVTNIVMTSLGDGYTSTPTVTLVAPFGGNTSVTATLGSGPNAISPSGGLTKNGVGTLTLAGANTYTGLTTVATGTLRLSGARLGGSLTVANGLTLAGSGSSTISGSVTMGSGGTVNLSNTVAATLTVTNGVTLNNNVLNFSLGGQSATNNIRLTGGSLGVSGINTVNVSAAGGFGTIGNYRLITGGGLANTNSFVLVGVPTGPFSFALTNSSGDLFVNVTSPLPVSAFWQGGASAFWNNNANWAPDAAGTNTIASPPGAPTTVEFATTNSPQNLSTTLGADFTINTLTFSTTNTVTVAGANTLTNINALTVGSSAGTVTISASGLSLGFDQTWVNNGSNPFTVSSPISGASALTIAGTGKTILSGTSTYTGGTTVNGGTLALANAANTLADTAPLTISNATVDIAANSDTVGGVTLISGTITGTVGVLSGSVYTTQVGTVSAILGGTGILNKFGPGTTVTLNRTNTYSGGTFVDEGTLVVDTGGSVLNTAFSSIGRQNSDNGTLTVQGNGAYQINADFNIGDIGAAVGTLNIADNARVQANNMYVGSANGGASTPHGTVNQTGGSLVTTATGDNSLTLGGRTSGTGNTGTAAYNMSGGTLLVVGQLFVGGYGTGTFNVNGGGVTVSNFVSVARFLSTASTQPASRGTLTISSGTFTQANPAAYTVIGEEGTGTLVIASSGLMYLNGNNGLVVGHINSGTGNNGQGVGTVNLNGGTLITTNVNRNLGSTNGTGFFNFNGGTLKAKGTHAAFMTGLTTATVQSAGAVIDDSGFNITIGQALLDGGGGGGLTKQGAGILTLTGTNTYTGQTLVSAGKLIASATMTGTGSITVSDTAALRVNAANTSQWKPTSLTLGTTAGATIEFNSLSNTAVPPLQVGTYTLNGIDRLKIIGGAFVVSNSYPLIHYTTLAGTGTNTFTPPGGMTATLTTITNTIYLNVFNFGTQLWTGNVNTNWDIEVTTNWTVNVVPSVYGDGGLVQFDDTATTTSVRIVSDVVPAAVIISNTAKTYTFSGAAISGFGTLTKMGSGLAVMSNKNSYSGDTTISSGTIRIATDNALPSGAGNGGVILNGTLDLAGHSNTINGLSGSGIVDSTVAGGAVLLVGSDGSSSIYSGVLQNTAATLALTKIGAGAFTLVGNNTHSGGTTLSAGQLNINSATALGAAAGKFTINSGTIDVTVSNDITVANNNPQAWNGDFTYAGSVTNLNLGTGAVTLLGSTNLQVTVTTNNLTVAGLISGAGSGLIKNGGGTLTLLGANDFGGQMFIVNGTLAVTTIGDTFVPGGVGAGLNINFGGVGPTTGILLYTGTGDDTFKQISLPNTAGNAVIDHSGSGMLIFESDLLVGGAGAHNFTVQGSGSGTGVVNGVISDNSAANRTTITKAGTGVWQLTAVNINTADTSLSNGTLIVTSIGNAGAPGNLGAGTNINIGSGVATGTLVYQGPGETSTKVIRLAAGFGNGGAVIDQSGTGLLKFSADVSTSGTATDHLFTLKGSTSGTGEIAGAIPNAGPGPTSILKTGTGLWTLSGVCSNTGTVTVNGGTLAISGTAVISNSPTITVAAGATLDLSVHTGGGMTFGVGQTLGGSGTVKGAVTIANGATLSPGSSPGTLTINGNLALNNSSTLAYELGTNSDRTVVNGNLTLSGFLTVTDAGGFAAGNYTLITYTGTLVNNALLVNNPLPGGRIGTIVAGGGTVVLQVGAGDPFATWQSQYFSGSSLSSAPGADPLGKGMSNTNQFLAGFNPTNAAAYLHITGIVKTNSGTDVRVDYLGASGDSSTTPPMASRTNVLEFTTGTAGNYSSNGFATAGVTNILSGGVGLGTLTNMVDPGGATNVPSRYYRVRVLVP